VVDELVEQRHNPWPFLVVIDSISAKMSSGRMLRLYRADRVAGDRVLDGGSSGGQERVHAVDDAAGLLDLQIVGRGDADLGKGVVQLAVLPPLAESTTGQPPPTCSCG
jgi:hypothetical protein